MPIGVGSITGGTTGPVHRYVWSFPFSVHEVRVAASAKVDYHRERLGVWEMERAKAEAEYKDRAVTFREPNPGLSYSGGPRPVIAPDVAQWLERCIQKVESHRRHLGDYEAFVLGLSQLDKDEALDLTSDDIRYFGMAGLPEDDEREMI